jgi:hypothetical protein
MMEPNELYAIGIDGSRSVYVRNPDGSWPALPNRVELRASADAVGREAVKEADLEQCFYCKVNCGWYACKDGRFVGRAKPGGWRIGDQPADWKVVQ